MSSLDPCYTDYSSIEEFLIATLSLEILFFYSFLFSKFNFFLILRCTTHPFGKCLLDYDEYFKSVFLCSKKDYTQKKNLDKMVANVRSFVGKFLLKILKFY